MKEVTINAKDEYPLRWPSGWERTPIANRKSQTSWKKPLAGYRKLLLNELAKLGISDCLVTMNPSPADRMDPGVAVYFSKPIQEDYSWQTILGLGPAPTLDQIDSAYRVKAMQHHPDRGGDIEIFKTLSQYRDRARAWVLGTHTADHEYVIPCDRFSESRLNMNGVRLAIAAFRQLERVGVPAILERSFRGFKTALPANASSEVHSVPTVA
jgi:hypothetical protein